MKNKAIILMYHQIIIDDKLSEIMQPGMYVLRDTFDKHIRYLKRKFDIIPLSNLIELIEKGNDISGKCVITFDDGWLDTYEHAYPIILKYKVPICVFLTTGFIESKKTFWFEEIKYHLKENFIESLGLINNKCNKVSVKVIDQEFKSSIFDKVIEEMKKLEPEIRNNIINKLNSMKSDKNHHFPMISWDNAKDMLRSGYVEFGAHTVNHIMLDQVDNDIAEKEISISIKDIYEKLNYSTYFFSYPNGNYLYRTMQLIKKLNIKAALTTTKGYVSLESNLLQLPRVAIHEDITNNLPRFLAHIIFPGF